MNHLTPEQRFQIVEIYFQKNKSVREVYRALRAFYGRHNRPSEQAIRSIIHRFRTNFTLLDSKPSTRQRNVRTEEAIASVARSVEEDAEMSIRCRSQLVGLCPSTTWKILRKDLGLVQYIIVRSDLKSVWPLEAVIAQCCHATAAVMHLNSEDSDTMLYLKDLDNMHKVVLEIKDEESIKALSEKLKQNDINHKLWIEQPENIPTCIAVKPYPKESVQKHLKGLKLVE